MSESEKKGRQSGNRVSKSGDRKPKKSRYSHELDATRLPDFGPAPQKTVSKSRFHEVWRRLQRRTREIRAQIHKKGMQRLTIMVIPHTEKQILNFHLSVYALTGMVVVVAVVLIVSVFNLAGKSGEDIQFYDMGLTNRQFNLQSTKMAEEMMPLHETIAQYTNTIYDLYRKLDGSGSEAAQGGAAVPAKEANVQDLAQIAQACRSLGEKCDQKTTEDILRRMIYLSKQDNINLKKAIDLSEKIIADLKTPEKQNLLRHTPSIWPTKGYLLSPHGYQVGQFEGKRLYRQGLQIGALPGTAVYATAPGTVTSLNYDSVYGLNLWISHRYGIKTFYAHMDRVRIALGDKVNKGDVIGYVGKSGSAPVYMLYYEVHVGTVAYNPHAFLNHLQDQWLIQPKP